MAFTCSKWIVRTLEQDKNIFKDINKDAKWYQEKLHGLKQVFKNVEK